MEGDEKKKYKPTNNGQETTISISSLQRTTDKKRRLTPEAFSSQHVRKCPTHLIAEGLHGQDREGLLKLSANLLNTEKHGRDNEHGGDEGGVVPRRREGVVHTEGQEKQPDGEESSQVARIEERNGTGQQPLRTSQVVLEDGNGTVNLILSQKVHGQIVDGKTQVLKGTVGTVGGSDNLLRLLGGKLLIQLGTELGLILLFGAEMTLHGTNKGPSAKSDVVEIIGTLSGGGTRGVIEGVGHANKIAGVVDVHTPVLTGLVPALVRRVGTEDEEKTKGGAGHGEDVEGKGELGKELDKSRMLDPVKVGVSMGDAVVHNDHGGNESNETDLTEEVFVNTGTEDGG